GVDVREHGEAVSDEDIGRLQRLDRVGQQVPGVGGDLELDPLGQARGPGQTGQPYRLLGVVRPAGVGQQQDAVTRDGVEDVLLGGGVDAAQGDGDHRGAARLDRRGQGRVRGELPGAEAQPGRYL